MPAAAAPVGDMKKIVSLVDRGAFDNIVYPQDATTTVFQPAFRPYHNFTQDVTVWPFAGAAEWGKRITFTVPWPWQTDLISWVALRLKPFHWLPADAYNHLYVTQDWKYFDASRGRDEWVWAKSLGSVAIAKAELEVDGVIVEQWSGDWSDVWRRASLDPSKGIGADDAMFGIGGGPTPTEDGYVYCYLPFWFSRWTNTAFPLVSTERPVRIHITLRPFTEVVRHAGADKSSCDETPLGQTFQVRDLTVPVGAGVRRQTVTVGLAVPTMEVAELVCGTAMIDGELRKAYRDAPHEIMMNPVVEMAFSEPLKYLVGVPNGDTVTIGLPLTAANGPLRQIFWFLRRKDVANRCDWTNYSATLEGEVDTIFNPRRPLLRSAQLLVGTAVWVDQDEAWWRSQGALPLAGGYRVAGGYVYAYNFTEKPNSFAPAGSLNASRVDLRLNLVVEAPVGAEWEVVVFFVGTNWMRFQNGLPNLLFMD
jgi:Major capsid protein N-terminus